MSDQKNIVFLVDPQNDFCDLKGSLFVKNADHNMRSFENFMKEYWRKTNQLLTSLDDHPTLHIGHPFYWTNKNGETPEPIKTVITKQTVMDFTWFPRNIEDEDWVLSYLDKLEKKGKYQHRIWPEHCVAGSWGAAMFTPAFRAVSDWERKTGKSCTIIRKGQNRRVEHFSAYEAEVVDSEDYKGTSKNALIDKACISALMDDEIKIIVAGEALSHCVANTVRDIVFYYSELAPRIIILEDCTSSVPGLESLGEEFKKEVSAKGVQFLSSKDLL